jgi:hypothetical protein
MQSMSTLGLSGETSKEESRWKALFWPSIHNSHDADLLGQQGFWICQIVALLSGLFPLFTAHPLIGVLAFLFYVLGGIGVREGSITASSLVFAAYLLGVATAIRMGAGAFGIIRFIFLAILLANLRGSILIARWKKPPRVEEDDSEPMRFHDTWRDKFCDQLPAKAWPVLQYAFYIVAALLVGLEVLGVIALFFMRHG